MLKAAVPGGAYRQTHANMDSSVDLPPGEERQRIQAERTRQVFALARYGQPLGVVAAAVLAIALRYAGGSPWLVAWVGAKAAIIVWEAVFGRAYRASTTQGRWSPRWERLLAAACLMLGCLWAALPLFMMPEQPSLQIITVITVVGVTTATLGALGVSAIAFHAYVTPTLAGLVAACLIRGGLANTTLGILIVVYLVFLACVQRALAAQFVERVRTRIHNEQLVARLQRTEAALTASLAEHELLFDLASVGIAEFRLRRIVRTNARLEQMLGYEPDALLGASEDILQPPDDRESVGQIADMLSRGLTVERDLRVRRRDGSALWVGLACRAIDPAHPARGVIAVFNDITDRREREVAMHRLAHEDALTGLPNRRLLGTRVREALLRAQRCGGCIAVLLIDLDGFKKINDAHGHEVGDQVLIAVARRLRACVRESDTVSRLGGDEFVVLLDSAPRADDTHQVARTLIDAVREPIAVGARLLRVGASVGIGIAPDDGIDAEALLRCADAAMYRAKQAGRDRRRLHRDETAAPAGESTALRV
jgi:diguanylate cyclase (GGDEF)-like protein/PAS domain S-box-containing protein